MELRSNPATEPPERPAGVSNEALWSRLLKAADIRGFASNWLALQAGLLPPLRASVLILGEPDAGPFAPVGVHPAPASISADLSIAAEAALTDRKGVLRERPSGRDEGAQCVALPLIIDERLHGVVAVELAPPFREPLAEVGRRLQWGAAWIESQIRKRSFLPQQQLVEILDLVALTMEAPRLDLALLGLANDLTRILGADWTGCGLVAPSSLVEVRAISHGVTLSKRSELVNAIAAAMQETSDQQEIITVPEASAQATRVVTRAHDELAEKAGAGPIMSVPIAHDGRINGVITVKFPANSAVTDREREFCRLVGTVLGPLVEFKRRDDRWIGAKVADVARDHAQRLVGPGHLGFKLAAIIVLLTAAILSLVSAEYRVTAAATLEGAVQRVVAAPLQGYIAQAGPRAGDNVTKGELLARLDDRALKVEQARWLSEREQRVKEYQRALAEGDRSRTQVLHAEIDQSQARIDLIEEQLGRIEIRAPFDGIVVRGDLSQMLGAPVQRGDVLFEIAPLDDYRILLRVDERDISDVVIGQKGTLILSSLTFLNLPFEVSKLTPISAPEEGQNTFRVEAQLMEKNTALRFRACKAMARFLSVNAG